MTSKNPFQCACRQDERGTLIHVCPHHEAQFRRERDMELADEVNRELRATSRDRHEYDEWREDDDRQRARDINEANKGL